MLDPNPIGFDARTCSDHPVHPPIILSHGPVLFEKIFGPHGRQFHLRLLCLINTRMIMPGPSFSGGLNHVLPFLAPYSLVLGQTDPRPPRPTWLSLRQWEIS